MNNGSLDWNTARLATSSARLSHQGSLIDCILQGRCRESELGRLNHQGFKKHQETMRKHSFLLRGIPNFCGFRRKKRWKKQNHCRELYTILCSYFPLFISHFCLGVVLIHEILKQPRGANGFPGHTQAVSPRILSRGSIIIVTPRTP